MVRKATVVKVKKNPRGEVTDVMLDNGNVYSINEVMMMAEDGLVENIVVKEGKGGKEYFKRAPINLGDDSFNNLPEF